MFGQESFKPSRAHRRDDKSGQMVWPLDTSIRWLLNQRLYSASRLAIIGPMSSGTPARPTALISAETLLRSRLSRKTPRKQAGLRHDDSADLIEIDAPACPIGQASPAGERNEDEQRQTAQDGHQHAHRNSGVGAPHSGQRCECAANEKLGEPEQRRGGSSVFPVILQGKRGGVWQNEAHAGHGHEQGDQQGEEPGAGDRDEQHSETGERTTRQTGGQQRPRPDALH